ncbi:hypothetical protein SEA_ACOLYTE_80 [Mycobacterium phage Acolyte]|nr:hypothetical protein SEA_ACOLYTE_80 [Mycobacterium phage Acolyte]
MNRTSTNVLLSLLAAFTAVGAMLLADPAEGSTGPLEDEPGWSCVDDGNRICGPGNDEGKPAGCYDDGGVLVAEWPCKAWQPSDGYRHGDGTVTYPDPDEPVYLTGYTN